MMTSLKLRRYLLAVTESLRKTSMVDFDEINFCLGNEAADADSIVSALCYAYLKQAASDARKLFVPVVCVPSTDIALRGDVSLLFKKVLGEDASKLLISVDSIPGDIWSSSVKKNLVLLDHNKVQDCFLTFLNVTNVEEAPVIEILDHHIDLEAHSHTCNGDSRNIAFDITAGNALVGSACTLVYEKFQSQFRDDDDRLDDAVSTLLLGVISLDTLDMNPVAGKGTARDAAALIVLERSSFIDRSQLFTSLRDAKSDHGFWSALSAADALRLDYKTFKTATGGLKFGVSSLLLSIHDFFSKGDSGRVIADNYLHEESSSLDVLVLMTLTPIAPSSSNNSGSTQMRRELAIISRSHATLMVVMKKVHAALGDRAGHPLMMNQDTLTPLVTECLFILAFTDIDVKVSRKVLAPILIAE